MIYGFDSVDGSDNNGRRDSCETGSYHRTKGGSRKVKIALRSICADLDQQDSDSKLVWFSQGAY